MQKTGGFSLVEVLIVVGLMSLISLGLASMMSDQQKEIKAFEEKIALQNLQQAVMAMLQNQSSCKANLTAPGVDIHTANTSVPSPNPIVLNELRVGSLSTSPLLAKKTFSLPGKLPGKMVVSAIEVRNILQTGTTPNEYKGTLTITFDPTSMSRVIKPVEIENLIFTIIPPATLAVVDTCGSTNTAPAGTLCGIQWNGGSWLAPLAECNGSTTPPGARTVCPSGYANPSQIILDDGHGNQMYTCMKQ